MKIRVGQMVKVADIGQPGKVVKASGEYVSIVFRFRDAEETVDGCPVSIIEEILEEGGAAA